MHDFNHWSNAIQIERKFVTTISKALAGSGKPFVATSDSGVLGDTKTAIASEKYPISKHSILSDRAKAEQAILQASQLDIRTMIIRLPFYVYGRDGGTSFAAMQVRAALEMGVCQYVESGYQKVSAAHVDNVAQLYQLALEEASAGSLFHAATESGIEAKEIAEAIAEIGGYETESICFEEALFNWGEALATFFSINNQISATKAIEQLGWNPQVERSLLEEIRTGWYHTLCRNFDDSTRLEMLRLLYGKSMTLAPSHSTSGSQVSHLTLH